MSSFLPQKAKLLMTLRAQAIMQPDILSAIETIPRELFIPENLHTHAYENASLPIGHKQTISQPYIVAVMTQALELKKAIECWKSVQEAAIRPLSSHGYPGGFTRWNDCAP